MHIKLLKTLCLLTFLILAASCQSKKNSTPVLEQKGFVNDYASVLTQEESAELTSELTAYEKETCHQVIVLTVPSLKGESIKDFSSRTATAWELGQPRLNNGILLTIAMEEGQFRLEAGGGLEFLVKAGEGERILQQVMLPFFKNDKISAGISSGAKAIMETARQKKYPANHKPQVCL